MKRKFYSIAKKLGYEILEYHSYLSKGMGGLQVFDILVSNGSKRKKFSDSYFHLSGDAPKVIKSFEDELKKFNPQTPAP